MIDVASEQRCVAVVSDAFVIDVLGLQMFTKLLRFSPVMVCVLAGKGCVFSKHLHPNMFYSPTMSTLDSWRHSAFLL